MELIGVVCLLALYKFLDSPSRVEPIVIESYHAMTNEMEQ